MRSLIAQEMAVELGESVKLIRLNQNIGQAELAEHAGVSLQTLRNVENGQGVSLYSFLCVLRALGREKWIETLEPLKLVNPLTFTARSKQRRRARQPKRK